MKQDDPYVYFSLGRIYSTQHKSIFDPEKAKTYYEKALELDPGNLGYYQELARCYIWMYNKDKAIEVCNQALNSEPKRSKYVYKEIYRLLANIYEEKKDYAKAIEYFKQVIDIDPSDESAKGMLDYLTKLSNAEKTGEGQVEDRLEKVKKRQEEYGEYMANYKKQQEEYKKILEDAIELQKKEEAVLEKNKQQQERFDAVLSVWEAQQKQYQEYLDKLKANQ